MKKDLEETLFLKTALSLRKPVHQKCLIKTTIQENFFVKKKPSIYKNDFRD
jgi:hypothetical protein